MKNKMILTSVFNSSKVNGNLYKINVFDGEKLVQISII